MKILMVCLGNICRSPLAEGILKKKILNTNKKWYVDSAGTYHGHVGKAPDKRSIKIAKSNNIDISEQKARLFNIKDLHNFDIVYVMDFSNKMEILSFAHSDKHRAKVVLIMDEVHPNENIDIPDPYINNNFEIVYKMLDEVCDKIIHKY